MAWTVTSAALPQPDGTRDAALPALRRGGGIHRSVGNDTTCSDGKTRGSDGKAVVVVDSRGAISPVKQEPPFWRGSVPLWAAFRPASKDKGNIVDSNTRIADMRKLRDRDCDFIPQN